MPAINLNRRAALTAIAGTSAAFTLAACAAEPELAATTPPSATVPEASADPDTTPEATTDSTAQPVGSVSDVPVGGATRFLVAGTPVIITQPSEGEFRGFVAICTHAGSAISGLRENDLYCGSHSSRFSTDTGEVISGPARNPLGRVGVSVEGDQLLVTL